MGGAGLDARAGPARLSGRPVPSADHKGQRVVVDSSAHVCGSAFQVARCPLRYSTHLAADLFEHLDLFRLLGLLHGWRHSWVS